MKKRKNTWSKALEAERIYDMKLDDDKSYCTYIDILPIPWSLV